MSDNFEVGTLQGEESDLRRECKYLAKQVLFQSGAASADVVETLAAQFHEMAARHQDFVRNQRESDAVIAHAVRYIADVHALPVLGTDTRWFRSALDVLMEVAVPNTGLTDEAVLLLPCLQEGIASSLSQASVPRSALRLDVDDARTVKRLERCAVEYGVMSDLLDLVERLYHGDALDEGDQRFFQVAAMASPLARQARVEAGVDKP